MLSNFLSSNCSYGQVEFDFDNPYKNILREGREFFTYCPKMIRNLNFFLTINFSPTCSSAHVECNFDNSWNNFGNWPGNVCSTSKNDGRSSFFWKSFSQNVLLTGRMNALWQTRSTLFNRRPKSLRSLSEKEEGIIFWWEDFFPRIVPVVKFFAILLNPSEEICSKAKFVTVDVRQWK